MQTDRSVGLKHDGAGRRIFYADRPKCRAETRWRREAHFICECNVLIFRRLFPEDKDP